MIVFTSHSNKLRFLGEGHKQNINHAQFNISKYIFKTLLLIVYDEKT